jgi:hypothetical protein
MVHPTVVLRSVLYANKALGDAIRSHECFWRKSFILFTTMARSTPDYHAYMPQEQLLAVIDKSYLAKH